MRLILAGASGYVGEHLLARLGGDHEVYALSRRRPSTLRPTDTWIPVDFNEGIDAGSLPGQVDVVVHLAVSYRHREFPEAAADLFAVNTASAVTLADWARRSGVPRFIYGSTGSVYSTDGAASQHEASAVAPDAFWTATKRAAEMLIEQFSEHLDVWIPRLFFPYGGGQTARLIPNLVDSVRNGRPVTLHGPTDADGESGGMALGPIHISDVADIVIAALAEGWSGVMNLAGPQTYTLRELVCEIGRQVGREPIFELVDGPPAPRFEPNLDRLDAAYGVDRLADFPEGLARLLAHLGE